MTEDGTPSERVGPPDPWNPAVPPPTRATNTAQDTTLDTNLDRAQDTALATNDETSGTSPILVTLELPPDDRPLEQILAEAPTVALLRALADLERHPDGALILKDLAKAGQRAIKKQKRIAFLQTGSLQTLGFAMIVAAVLIDAGTSLPGASFASLVLAGAALIGAAPWVAAKVVKPPAPPSMPGSVYEVKIAKEIENRKAQQEQHPS